MAPKKRDMDESIKLYIRLLSIVLVQLIVATVISYFVGYTFESVWLSVGLFIVLVIMICGPGLNLLFHLEDAVSYKEELQVSFFEAWRETKK